MKSSSSPSKASMIGGWVLQYEHDASLGAPLRPHKMAHILDLSSTTFMKVDTAIYRRLLTAGSSLVDNRAIGGRIFDQDRVLEEGVSRREYRWREYRWREYRRREYRTREYSEEGVFGGGSIRRREYRRRAYRAEFDRVKDRLQAPRTHMQAHASFGDWSGVVYPLPLR
jgi:hypothetical protein